MTPDPRARFEHLWNEHGRAVLRYAQRRAAPEDVDDVVAETFVVAWRRIDELPPHALPWLLAVARGVAANSRRAQLRRQALHQRLEAHDDARRGGATRSAGDQLTGGPAGAGPAGSSDAVDAVQEALTRLSATDREALTLIAWDGLSRAEAAEALGCTRAALAVRIHRARRRLAAALGPAPAQPPPAAPVDGPTHRPPPPRPPDLSRDLANTLSADSTGGSR